MAAKQEFESRFAKHKDELEWLFMELYHNREGLEVLEREMAEAYNARSAELKALDKARSADPEWYKRGNMFGMTMYTDLFAGNLKELAKKLPYLKEQKLTYLHLMPLLQMPHPHNDGGYAVEDFDTVDPTLGTQSSTQAPSQESRKKSQGAPASQRSSKKALKPNCVSMAEIAHDVARHTAWATAHEQNAKGKGRVEVPYVDKEVGHARHDDELGAGTDEDIKGALRQNLEIVGGESQSHGEHNDAENDGLGSSAYPVEGMGKEECKHSHSYHEDGGDI